MGARRWSRDRAPKRVRVQVSIAMRGCSLRVSDKLSYDRQAHGSSSADADE